ncbi:MAG: T9SS type A sorting domain-containing protein [Bacteroidales bacterium]|nr:T9SS type A sorting domain-containing protein [Bacteroidales bacterium]
MTIFPVAIDFIENSACPPTNSIGNASSEDMDGMNFSAEKADSINNILTELVDGGSTGALSDEVASSTPPDALPTRDVILTSSPYVSDTVIQTAIEKEDVLNNAMIRDIMVANPHSAKSEILVDMLENRTTPMPDYLMAEILQGEDSISSKELLESQRAFWNADRSQHYHNLIRYYRTDSVLGLTNDSLIYLLQLRNTVGSWYDLTATYFQRGDYQTGLNILNLIPSSFTLSDKQQVIRQSYENLYEILRNVATDSSRVMNIDSTDKHTLESISDSNLGQISAFARNLLVASAATNYLEPIFLPETELKSSKRDKYRGAKTSFKENLLNVYPNPAKTYFVVQYHLNEIPEECFIELTNIMGKPLSRIPVQLKDDQMVIPVNNLNQGVYIVTLKNKGNTVQQTKISLIR